MNYLERRKQLLVEIMSEGNLIQNNIFLPSLALLTQNRFISSMSANCLFQDRFCVQMQCGDFFINPERIKGFKIEHGIKNKHIKVKTILHIENWISDFKKIEIIKIHFFDLKDNLIKNSFDYDVAFKSFCLECDYQTHDYLTPVFEYEIFDSDFEK